MCRPAPTGHRKAVPRPKPNHWGNLPLKPLLATKPAGMPRGGNGRNWIVMVSRSHASLHKPSKNKNKSTHPDQGKAGTWVGSALSYPDRQFKLQYVTWPVATQLFDGLVGCLMLSHHPLNQISAGVPGLDHRILGFILELQIANPVCNFFLSSFCCQ